MSNSTIPETRIIVVVVVVVFVRSHITESFSRLTSVRDYVNICEYDTVS